MPRSSRTGGLLGPISQGHHYFGFNRGERDGKPGVWYREWAPGALQLRLIGDFNGWDRCANPMVRDQFGVWSLFLPDDEYADRLMHGSRVKVHVVTDNGGAMDRIPAYIRRVVQEPGHDDFTGQLLEAAGAVRVSAIPCRRLHQAGSRIYEAHVGMAQEEAQGRHVRRVHRERPPAHRRTWATTPSSSWRSMEHPYYGSFGYHVSNFFARLLALRHAGGTEAS